MFGMIVYFLCGLTSLLCVGLLARSYKSTKNRLVFWTAICFSFLTLNNFFVILDFVIFANIDFSLARNITLLIGPSLLVFGLIWDTI